MITIPATPWPALSSTDTVMSAAAMQRPQMKEMAYSVMARQALPGPNAPRAAT
jgi:hypothetical protein